MKQIKIAHLSDLHFGYPWGRKSTKGGDLVDPLEWKPYDRLIDFLRDGKPDYIVVSGDFIEAPRGKSLKRSSSRARREQLYNECRKDFLDKLQEVIAIGEPDNDMAKLRILLVPGNHDVDWYSKEDKRLTTFNEKLGWNYPSPFFVNGGSSLLKKGVYNCGNCFAFVNDKILFCLLSSCDFGGSIQKDVNKAIAFINKYLDKIDVEAANKGRRVKKRLEKLLREDFGYVSEGMIKSIGNNLRDLRHTIGDSLASYTKIAVMHHHLAHHSSSTTVEPYAEVINAAQIKDALCANGFDMALYGHQHSPLISYEISNRASKQWGLHLIGAGSAAGKDKDPSFYYITRKAQNYDISEISTQDKNTGSKTSDLKWLFTGGQPPRREVPIVTWPGYQESTLIRREASQFGIRFLEHNGIGGRLIDLKLDEKAFDLIIDDYDYLLRMAQANVLELGELSADSKPNWNKLRRMVPRGLLAHKASTKHLLLPLRCGLNAIAVNEKSFCEPGKLTIRSLLIDDMSALLKKGDDDDQHPTLHVACWDNAFVNIPLLLAAKDVPISLQYANKADREVLDNLVKWIDKNKTKFKERDFTVSSNIHELRDWLDTKVADAVIGGGAWLSKKSGSGKVQTVVPREGALLWVESAGVILKGGNSPAFDFLERLLQHDVQREIAGGSQYLACPIVPLPNVWDNDLYDVKHIFADSSYLKLNTRIVPRNGGVKYPKLWESTWASIKEILGQ